MSTLIEAERSTVKTAQRQKWRHQHQYLTRLARVAQARGDLLGAQVLEAKAIKVLDNLAMIK